MARSREVLLVEDDPAWALLTSEAFADAAPEVSVQRCSTGRDALARFRVEPWPDAVLLDLNLPDLDGVDVLRALRGLPGAQDLVVVVLSASRAAADRSLAEQLGATAYREKPTTYSELLALARDVAHGATEAFPPDRSTQRVWFERSLRGPEQP
ncbi:MAG TPA: response regulator [Acidimicrobiales bacterium]|nr:response regulator [Acidimicrobiales bacterium]